MLGAYSLWEVGIFAAVVVVALLVDLFAHKKNEAISFKSALAWSIFWVALGLGFAVYVGVTHGPDQSYLYLAGYLLEKSLSVDNLFVFMAIFASFAIKDEFQHRVLYYGIVGALILRLVFVAAGVALLQKLGPIALVLFGLFVLWSAWKMWQESRKPEREIVDYTDHFAVKWTRKIMPVTKNLDGEKFFTKLDGRWHLTPLFLCLILIELADVVFAFDSVPAIIAVTQEPFLVYTSNIFAILGLRSMYFLLAAAKRYLIHLEKAVIVILAFIGVKMLVAAGFGFHLNPTYSLIVVLGVLSMGVLASIIFPAKDKSEE